MANCSLGCVDAKCQQKGGSLDAGTADSRPEGPPNATFTLDGQDYPSHSIYETTSFSGGPVPTRVYRVVLWPSALSDGMCQEFKRGKKVGSRELMLELHRTPDATGAFSLPQGTYMQNHSGPDGFTAAVNLRYYFYRANDCRNVVEYADLMQGGGNSATVAVTSASALSVTGNFAAEVLVISSPSDTKALKQFAGNFSAAPYCDTSPAPDAGPMECLP